MLGAVEAVFSLNFERKTLTTLNLDNPTLNTSINLIPLETISESVDNIISNSLDLVERTQIFVLKVIILYCFISPSGAGKTTISKLLIKR